MQEAGKLKGYQRAELMKLAHHLDPVVTIGKNGASEALERHFERELEQHELVKVRFSDHKEARRQIAPDLAGKTGAILVSVVGHVAVFYRQARNPELRTIRIPYRPGDEIT